MFHYGKVYIKRSLQSYRNERERMKNNSTTDKNLRPGQALWGEQ